MSKNTPSAVKIDFNTLIEWEELEEKGELPPDKQVVLNKKREEIRTVFKPFVEVGKSALLSIEQHFKEHGEKFSRDIEKSKKNHPHEWRYIELCRELYLNKNPKFLIVLRRQIVALARRPSDKYGRGFPDIRIEHVLGDDKKVTLYSPTLGDLPEEKLAELLSELGSLLPRDLAKIPLRVLDRVKHAVERQLTEDMSVVDIEQGGPDDPFVDFEQIRQAIERLPETQKRVLSLVYYDGIRKADIARKLGISRAAVTKAHDTGIKNLKDILNITEII